MNSKLFTILLVVSFSTLFLACGKADSRKAEEVFIDDGKTPGGEVFVDESSFNGQPTQIATAKEASQELRRILDDSSVVETMLDGYGNKTEVRYFKNNPRLRFIVVRTSVTGNKQVTVYGYDTDTRFLDNFGDKALIASGDEIADTAGLYATRSFRKSKNFMKNKSTSTTNLRPLPSSSFPVYVQPQYVPPTTPVEEQTVTETNNQNPTGEKTSDSKVQPTTSVKYNQLENQEDRK